MRKILTFLCLPVYSIKGCQKDTDEQSDEETCRMSPKNRNFHPLRVQVYFLIYGRPEVLQILLLERVEPGLVSAAEVVRCEMRVQWR